VREFITLPHLYTEYPRHHVSALRYQEIIEPQITYYERKIVKSCFAISLGTNAAASISLLSYFNNNPVHTMAGVAIAIIKGTPLTYSIQKSFKSFGSVMDSYLFNVEGFEKTPKEQLKHLLEIDYVKDEILYFEEAMGLTLSLLSYQFTGKFSFDIYFYTRLGIFVSEQTYKYYADSNITSDNFMIPALLDLSGLNTEEAYQFITNNSFLNKKNLGNDFVSSFVTDADRLKALGNISKTTDYIPSSIKYTAAILLPVIDRLYDNFYDNYPYTVSLNINALIAQYQADILQYHADHNLVSATINSIMPNDLSNIMADYSVEHPGVRSHNVVYDCYKIASFAAGMIMSAAVAFHYSDHQF
jgi:hypothetical protein